MSKQEELRNLVQEMEGQYYSGPNHHFIRHYKTFNEQEEALSLEICCLLRLIKDLPKRETSLLGQLRDSVQSNLAQTKEKIKLLKIQGAATHILKGFTQELEDLEQLQELL